MTSSSERFESALVMLVALTSRLSASPVAGLSLSAVPARRVVLSVSSGVRFTWPGAQNGGHQTGTNKNAPSPAAPSQ